MKKYLLTLVATSFIISSVSFSNAQTCTTLTKPLSSGSKGSEVTALQQFLFDQGYLKTKPNGTFGTVTVDALKKFQQKNNLIVNGFVGPAARVKIKEISCKVSGAIIAPTQNSNTLSYLSPESVASKVNDHVLKVFSMQRIKDVYVTGVYKSGKDIIIEGSGFLSINRGPGVESDTCLAHNNPDFSEQVSDKKIILMNYVSCLPNVAKNYVLLGQYDGQANSDEVYAKSYADLGGTGKLERVEFYNRYVLSASTQESLKKDSIKMAAKEKKLVSDAFIQNLGSCKKYKENFTHPLTGDSLSREVIGYVEGKCNYTEQMPNGGKMECKYSLSDLSKTVKYYSGLNESSSLSFSATLGGSSVSSQTNDQNSKNSVQDALSNGVCVISVY